MLGPVLGPGPTHRATQLHGEPGHDHVLRVLVDLGAEPATEVRCDHPDLRLGQSEDRGDRRPRDVRHLGGRPYGQLAVAEFSDDASGLYRVRCLTVAREGLRDGGERRHPMVDVRIARREIEDLVVRPVLVEPRRVVCQRFCDGGDHGKVLVVDEHARGGVLSPVPVGSDDHGDRGAHVPHPVPGERELLHLFDEAEVVGVRVQACEVGPRPCEEHVLCVERSREVDGAHHGVKRWGCARTPLPPSGEA